MSRKEIHTAQEIRLGYIERLTDLEKTSREIFSFITEGEVMKEGGKDKLFKLRLDFKGKLLDLFQLSLPGNTYLQAPEEVESNVEALKQFIKELIQLQKDIRTEEVDITKIFSSDSYVSLPKESVKHKKLREDGEDDQLNKKLGKVKELLAALNILKDSDQHITANNYDVVTALFQDEIKNPKRANEQRELLELLLNEIDRLKSENIVQIQDISTVQYQDRGYRFLCYLKNSITQHAIKNIKDHDKILYAKPITKPTIVLEKGNEKLPDTDPSPLETRKKQHVVKDTNMSSVNRNSTEEKDASTEEFDDPEEQELGKNKTPRQKTIINLLKICALSEDQIDQYEEGVREVEFDSRDIIALQEASAKIIVFLRNPKNRSQQDVLDVARDIQKKIQEAINEYDTTERDEKAQRKLYIKTTLQEERMWYYEKILTSLLSWYKKISPALQNKSITKNQFVEDYPDMPIQRKEGTKGDYDISQEKKSDYNLIEEEFTALKKFYVTMAENRFALALEKGLLLGDIYEFLHKKIDKGYLTWESLPASLANEIREYKKEMKRYREEVEKNRKETEEILERIKKGQETDRG